MVRQVGRGSTPKIGIQLAGTRRLVVSAAVKVGLSSAAFSVTRVPQCRRRASKTRHGGIADQSHADETRQIGDGQEHRRWRRPHKCRWCSGHNRWSAGRVGRSLPFPDQAATTHRAELRAAGAVETVFCVAATVASSSRKAPTSTWIDPSPTTGRDLQAADGRSCRHWRRRRHSRSRCGRIHRSVVGEIASLTATPFSVSVLAVST